MIDSDFAPTIDPCTLLVNNPKDDFAAGTLIAISSIMGIIIWLVNMLIYLKNAAGITND